MAPFRHRRIPKIVHYCWFGGAPADEQMDRCLASWARHLPDYTVMRWDEANAPTEIPYVRNALAGGFWSNASNAVRLTALVEYGGIYLDTDVEVMRSFGSLLRLGCFMGFQYEPDDALGRPLDQCINNAVLGARRRHPFVADALTRLVDEFDGAEPANLSAPRLVSRLLVERGLRGYSDVPIEVSGVTILPKDAFYPYFYDEAFDPSIVTDRTYAVHYWAKRW